jgi:hypothetical protein
MARATQFTIGWCMIPGRRLSRPWSGAARRHGGGLGDDRHPIQLKVARRFREEFGEDADNGR